MLLKLKKPIFKYTLNKYHVHWLSSFKHLNLPISTKIPVTIWQIIYMITKFVSWTYTTFTNFSMKYLVMCKVYTDVGGIK